MPLSERQYATFLNQYAEELDIPPSKYQEAVQRYESVGSWLSYDGYEGCEGKEPIVYPQGSFRLGTVTRPIQNSKEGDYDIDLVCELSIHQNKTVPDHIKKLLEIDSKHMVLTKICWKKKGVVAGHLNMQSRTKLVFT